jgi:pimeloyl-ACP methyl ester carboxylesterase
MNKALIIKWLIYFLIAYGLYLLMLYTMQRRMLFPTHFIAATEGPALLPFNGERWWLSMDFGRVEAWYFPPKSPPGMDMPPKHGAVIFAHGNGELIDYWPHELSFILESGLGLLLIEYPGYGRSEGSPGQKSITLVFESAHEKLLLRPEIDDRKLVYLGRSVGGGAVCALSEKHKPAALILMSAFTSVRAFALRYGAPGIFVRDPFDNERVVRGLDIPVLIIHGRNDGIIPFSHAETLEKAARNSTLLVYQCGHNDCPPDWSVFRSDILGFLEVCGITAPAEAPHSHY